MMPISMPTTSWWRSPRTCWGRTGCPLTSEGPTTVGSSGYWCEAVDDRRVAVHRGGHLLHGIPGYDHRRHGSAANGAKLCGRAQRGEPRDDGLHADLGGFHPGERLD